MGWIKDKAQADLKALDFKLGVYRHYKGGLYVVFAVSLDEETLKPLVHYYSLAKETRWTRTLTNFTERIEAEFDGDATGMKSSAHYRYETGVVYAVRMSDRGIAEFPRFMFVSEANDIDFLRAVLMSR